MRLGNEILNERKDTGSMMKTGPLSSSKHSEINVLSAILRYFTFLYSRSLFTIIGSYPLSVNAHFKLSMKLKGE